jgi:hypothetical protein
LPAPSAAPTARLAQAESAPAPRAEGAAEKKKSAPSESKGRSAETVVQRADRLFAEGRWMEAAAAYRDLLRDDPRNHDADRWRKRVAIAEGEIEASQRPTAAKAAKAKASTVDDASK